MTNTSVNMDAYKSTDNVNSCDDKEEIISVSYHLSQRGLYGAAQMICRLARQRDEAREEKHEIREQLLIIAYAAMRLLKNDSEDPSWNGAINACMEDVSLAFGRADHL